MQTAFLCAICRLITWMIVLKNRKNYQYFKQQMSDLSLLIGNQDIPIDQTYLQQCKAAQNQKKHDKKTDFTSYVSEKNVGMKKNNVSRQKTFQPATTAKIELARTKSNNDGFGNPTTSNSQLMKLMERLQNLEQNQRCMEEKFGKQFFDIQDQIYRKKKQQVIQFEEVRKIKGQLQQSRKDIAKLLNLMAKKGR